MKWKLAALLVVAVVTILLYSTSWLASLGGRPKRARFRNPEPTRMMSGSKREMLRRQFFGKEQRSPLGTIPVERRTMADYETVPPSGLRATWIGWASTLIEIDGKRVMTDPVFSERCSPSTLVGPKRFHATPMTLEELPPIDVVVISHDHYDHLDMPVIRLLSSRGTHFFVPLGIGVHLKRWDVPDAQIHELNWEESASFAGLEFTSTRARHYSGRNPLYANQTLWTSWVVKGPKHRFFFSGDSGYTDAFKAIGEKHGPFDLTLIKIGASDPSWKEIHMTPEEAIATHVDVRGQLLIPVHWCTFNLGFHAWDDPVERALAEAAKSGARVYVPKPGERVEPSSPPPSQQRWWSF